MTKKDKYLRVQELLKEKGVNQKDLAKHLDMREDSFSLSLKNETLNVEKLAKIAKYLDVPIHDLFEKPIDISIDVSYQGETKLITETDLIKLFKEK